MAKRISPARPLILWISMLLACMPGFTGEMSLSALKAAYTLNFLNFTHGLPASEGADSKHLAVCVIGRLGIYREFEKNTERLLFGRALRIRRLQLPGNVSDCSVIYFEEFDLSRDRHLIGSLETRPILTVSDLPGFADKGGMVELATVDKRLRFEINLDAVRKAGLRLNPKLLKLATRVQGIKRAGTEP